MKKLLLIPLAAGLALNAGAIDNINEAATQTEGGWYTIKCIDTNTGNSGRTAGLNNYVLNAEYEYKQSDANWYPLRFNNPAKPNYVSDTDTEHAAKKFIYIKHTSGTTYNIRSANGHYVTRQTLASRTASDLTIAATPPKAQNGQSLGYWNIYSPAHTASNPNPDLYDFVGGGSGAAAGPSNAWEIRTADVSGYDIYTVTITDNNASAIGNDAHITYTGEGNCGIATVFNGGTYFFTRGTTPRAEDFVVTGIKPTTKPAIVTVNTDAKTISVTPEYYTESINNFTNAGWYVIKCIQTNDGDINGKTIMNAEDMRRQSATNFYPLRWDTEGEATGALTFVYMENGTSTNNYHFRALNGLWIQANVTASRTPQDVAIANGTGKIGSWHSWIDTSYGNSLVYVGGANTGSNGNLYDITPADLTGMVRYTVNITDLNAPEIKDDCRVTYTGEGNLGLPTVYNGGTFFLREGVTPTASDFEVTTAYHVSEPVSITVTDNTVEVTVPCQTTRNGYDGEGWYTIKNILSSDETVPGKYFINAESERSQLLSGNTNTYPVRYDLTDEAAPIYRMIYMKATATANVYNFRTISGRWLDLSALAQRTAQNVTIASDGTGKIGNWHPYVAADLDEYTYVGGYNGATSDPNRYEIEKVSVEDYDVYTVEMIGETLTSNDFTLDATVEYIGEAECAGFTRVFEGGTYFFPKGTELNPHDFVANQDGNDALITIGEDADGNKVITVDFAAISGKARTLLNFAEEHSGPGLHNGTFTGIEELQAAYDALIARIDAGDSDDELAPLRAACTTAYNAVTFTINPVEKSKYIRIRSSLHTQYAYASTGTSFGFVTDAEGEDEHDIFFYDAAGHLLNYNAGAAVKKGSGMDAMCSAAEHATLANANIFTFNGSDNRYRGKYIVSYMNGNVHRALYCYDNGNMGQGGDPANPGTTTFDLTYYQHTMFDLEYVAELPVNIVNAIGSLICPMAVELPAGCTAWLAQIDGTTLSWTEAANGHIPAHAHAVIYAPNAENGTINVTVSENQDGEYEESEILKGHHLTRQHAAGNVNFVLNLDAASTDEADEETPAAPTGVTLQKVNAASDITLQPHTFALYVSSPGAEGDDSLTLPFDSSVNLADVNTSVSEVNAAEADITVVYDLQGRRIAAPRKGAVNIVNGKKVYHAY